MAKCLTSENGINRVWLSRYSADKRTPWHLLDSKQMRVVAKFAFKCDAENFLRNFDFEHEGSGVWSNPI